jgi:predicted nucleic acid-binding protein
MYLWDSNILRYHYQAHPTLQAWLQKVPRHQIALPSVVVAEVLRGRCELALKATPEQFGFAHTQLQKELRVLRRFRIVFPDQHSTSSLAVIRKQHPSHKRYPDLMIAALAQAGNHIVITRNQKDFADLLPKSQLQNWIDDMPVN